MSHAGRDVAGLTALAEVAVIIVGFGNADDVACCLRALRGLKGGPRFDVFIAENSGPGGMHALRRALTAEGSPCRLAAPSCPALPLSPGLSATRFSLPRDDGGADALVHIALMPANLGYASAINAWLRVLMPLPGWRAAWLLNPDTEPAPAALLELARQALGQGMIASQVVSAVPANAVRTCGLRWCKITARTVAVGCDAIKGRETISDGFESWIDAPDGASIYVTRGLIDRIGLMDERYFLYYEDLEWGLRAKSIHQLGYAHASIVLHKGGTTIGSAPTRADNSTLAVFMEFRNRVLFVRHRYGTWLPWTMLMQTLHIATYLAVGSIPNVLAACQGLMAGWRDETGRPDRALRLYAGQNEAACARPVRPSVFETEQSSR
jgi:GT2 family glycosyltransferase